MAFLQSLVSIQRPIVWLKGGGAFIIGYTSQSVKLSFASSSETKKCMALPLHISTFLQDIALLQGVDKVGRFWLNTISRELQTQPAKFIHQPSRIRIEFYTGRRIRRYFKSNKRVLALGLAILLSVTSKTKFATTMMISWD
jgi:hypothetical protein